MSTMRVLPGGWKYLISIATSVLRANLAEGTREPMVNVKLTPKGEREGAPPHDVGTFRRIEILNPLDQSVVATLCEHYDKPIPGSDGRGVCYITTDAPVRVTEGEADGTSPEQHRA